MFETTTLHSTLRRWIAATALAASLVGVGTGASAQSVFTFGMDGAQAATASPATGTVTVTLNSSTGAVTVSGTFSGLLASASAAHIHGPAPPGAPAGIVVGLIVTGTTSGTITGGGTLTPAEVTDMLCGLHYVNLHSGMFPNGEIRGQVTQPASASEYGAGANPASSLVVLSGVPAINTSFSLGVDNPLGTQAVGSFAVLALAGAQDPTFVATGTGTMVPGFGMSAPGAPGELLVSLTPPNPIPPVMVGGPWTGAGNPVPFQLTVPNDKTLVGRTFFFQGLIFEPGGAITFGLTRAIATYIGL